MPVTLDAIDIKILYLMQRDASLSTAELAERVAGTLLLAAALAEAGRRLELEGLDRMVGLLCAQALDLPPALGHAFRPRLVGLLEDLDALGRRLVPG